MSEGIYFISDLHLDAQRPQVTRAFFDFLNTTAAKAEALYILGDFFEVWVGDDDTAPLAKQVITEVRRYSETGIQVFLMHGNRDFLLGETFAQQAGLKLLPDPHLVQLYGKPVLLMHGDSLCTDDTEYMAFRAQVRSPQWQAQILSQSLEQRHALAESLRQKSQSMNSLKAEEIMDVNKEEVLRVMEQYQVQRLIHGHTHRPKRHKLHNHRERIVLGDWCDKGWYLKATSEHIELVSFTL